MRSDAHPATSPLDRRRFIAAAGLAAGAAIAPGAHGAALRQPNALPEGEPDVPPGVGPDTIAHAQKLLGFDFTAEERDLIAETIPGHVAFYEHLRDAAIRNDEAPAETFDPRLPGVDYALGASRLPRFKVPNPGLLPADEQEIAYATVGDLSQWVRTRQITSERLTNIYIDRLKRLDDKLKCVITLMEDSALAQARAADKRIAAGDYIGPLHGLPWGAKDLLDTAGVRTTWGAEPWADRVPDRDAAVVRKLNDAGAVLIAKLSLGALAYGDIWHGGRTNNPWNLEQGSSGSSAGSAAAVAAGCAAFAIGTETYGSIGSPSARCGATGFRPTFGRVSRDGAMALCWSLDKIGPICRSAECCAYVLHAINGADAGDRSTIDLPLNLDLYSDAKGLKVGYTPAHYEQRGATDADRAVLDALRTLGCELVEVNVPEGPWPQLIFMTIIVEAAAAFDDMTRNSLDDQLSWQSPQAWPNTFRTGRFIPAVEYMQARRLRGRLMRQTHELFKGVDALIAPQTHAALHAITNMTGHPAITFRTGFREDGTPRANTLWGILFEDSKTLRLGHRIEHELDIWKQRPPID